MDSLLANYASSDEEDHEPQIPAPPLPSKTSSSSSSPFSSLPQSKSSSPLFQSLPQPKSSSSSSLFQSIPQPKQPSSATATATRSNLTETPSFPNPKSQIDKQQQPPKKVVQFKPPIIPLAKPTQFEDDDDDDEEDERNRRRKLESSIEAPSVKSFLSTLLPAPRNSATLGVQSSSGSGRRSIIETDAPAPATNSGGGSMAVSEVPVDQSAGDYGNYQYANYQYAPEQYGDYANYQYNSGFVPEAGVATATSYENSDNAYASYGAYGDYGQYGNNWVDGSAATEASGIGDSVVRIPGKRGRNEVPAEVIEVRQEELIKNRPREDQAKLTGIAFGPAYQPVSTKGKPSKLHKRKHQIGSLFFDMKQNEMKLAERRSKGMLTKAETQAKYGW